MSKNSVSLSLRTGMILAVVLVLALLLGIGATAAPETLTVEGALISSGGGIIGFFPRSVDGIIAQPILAQGETGGVQIDAGLGGVIASSDAGGAEPLPFQINLPQILH